MSDQAERWEQEMRSAGWWTDSDGRWYSPPAPGTPDAMAQQDPWFIHFLLFLAVYIVMIFSIYLFGLGLFWIWWMIYSTGRRGWWFLALIVPGLGVYVFYTAVWRYTSKTIYFVPNSPEAGPLRTLFTAKWQSAENWERFSMHGLLWSLQKRPDEVAEMERRSGRPPTITGPRPPGISTKTTKISTTPTAAPPDGHEMRPAGWYPDPNGALNALRYWDGERWTSNTAIRGE